MGSSLIQRRYGPAKSRKTQRIRRGPAFCFPRRRTLANARVPMQIDIGFGDVVTPDVVDISTSHAFCNTAPVLRAYPKETVVAGTVGGVNALGDIEQSDERFLRSQGRSRLYAGRTHLWSRRSRPPLVIAAWQSKAAHRVWKTSLLTTEQSRRNGLLFFGGPASPQLLRDSPKPFPQSGSLPVRPCRQRRRRRHSIRTGEQVARGRSERNSSPGLSARQIRKTRSPIGKNLYCHAGQTMAAAALGSKWAAKRKAEGPLPSAFKPKWPLVTLRSSLTCSSALSSIVWPQIRGRRTSESRRDTVTLAVLRKDVTVRFAGATVLIRPAVTSSSKLESPLSSKVGTQLQYLQRADAPVPPVSDAASFASIGTRL